jgi:hypothetical protein
LLDKPGRTSQESPRRWHGANGVRQVEVEYADGRLAVKALRLLVVYSSQLAQQAASASTAAQAKEAERLAEHIQRVEAHWFAVRLTPRRPVLTMKVMGRADGAASRACDAIMRSTIE